MTRVTMLAFYFGKQRLVCSHIPNKDIFLQCHVALQIVSALFHNASIYPYLPAPNTVEVNGISHVVLTALKIYIYS